MKPMQVIYKLTNTTTGEFYIGRAKCAHARMLAHRARSRHGAHDHLPLYANIKKYGEHTFMYQLVESKLSWEDALVRERHWVQTLKPQLNRILING